MERFALDKHSSILGPILCYKENEVLQIWLQETNIAIAYEQQGYFEQAQGAYELAMTKFRNDYNGQASPIGVQQVSRRHGRKTPALSVQGTLAGDQPGRKTEKDILIDLQFGRETDWQKDMQADAIRETDEQTGRYADRSVIRETDKQTER